MDISTQLSKKMDSLRVYQLSEGSFQCDNCHSRITNTLHRIHLNFNSFPKGS